jgi:hypothetical protein
VASLQDYLSGVRPQDYKSLEENKNLLSSISAYQTNRAAGAALGADVSAKPKQGLLSWFLGDVVGAPAKAVRGVVFGDPNKTGGDVLKVNEDDSFAEKAGKYAGAFALDVVTDPLSYVGGGTVLGRKALAETAALKGPKMLQEALEMAPKVAPNVASRSVDIIDSLYNNAKVVQQARAGVGDVALLGEVDNALRMDIAGQEFGRIFGESLWTRSRKGAIDDLAEVFGDREFATQVIRSQGPQFEGGVWLSNPVTGRPWKRITPGTGVLGPVSDTVSGARRAVSTAVGKPLKEFQDGRFGGLWQATKEGFDPVTAVGNDLIGRDTIADYASYKVLERAQRAQKLGGRFAGIGLGVAARGQAEELATRSPKAAEDYYAGLLEHYHHPMRDIPVDSTPEYVQGVEQARALHDASFELATEAYAKGALTTDEPPRWGHVPLVKEKEVIAAERVLQPRKSGPGRVISEYNPTVKRQEGMAWVADKESGLRQGVYAFDDPEDFTLIKSPLTLNAETGAAEYITDPIRLFELNYEGLTKRTISKEFTDELIRLGLVVRNPEAVQSVVDANTAEVYRDAVEKVSPQLAKRVKEARDLAEAKLREQLDPQLDATVAEVIARRNRLDAEYKAAVVNERELKKEITQLRQQLRKAKPSAARIINRLRRYANEQLEVNVEEARTPAATAGKRVKAAAKQADKTAERVENTGTVAAVVADDAAQANLSAKTAAKINADYELEFARLNRDDVRKRMSAEQIAEVDEVERLATLIAKREDGLKLAATMKEDARIARNKARRVTKLENVQSLENYVDAYVQARTALRRLELRYNFKDRDSVTQAIRAQHNEAKNLVSKSRSELRRVLNIARESREGGLVADYANTLLRLADNLSDADVTVARVMASDERLSRIVRALDTAASPAARDTAITRLVSLYNEMRKFVTPEDLEILSEGEQALVGATKVEAEKAAKAAMAASELRARGLKQIAPDSPDVILPRGLDDVYVAEGVRDILERVYRVESNPSSVKKFVEQTIEPLLLLWKSSVTVLRGPAYIVNNVGGGILHNFYQGTKAKRMAQTAKFAADMVKAFRSEELRGLDIFERLTKTQTKLFEKYSDTMIGDMNIVDIMRWYVLNSGMADSQTASVIRRLAEQGTDIEVDAITGIPRRISGVNETVTAAERGKLGRTQDRFINFAIGNKLSMLAADGAQLSEFWLRFSSFTTAYEQTGNLDAALLIADNFHFNYENLSDAERAVRRFVPFYAWTRNNVPLQIRAMLLQPGKIQRAIYAQQEAGKAFGPSEDDAWMNAVLPEYISQVGGFATGVSGEGGPLAFSSRLPFSDIDRLFTPGLMPVNLREVGNLIGPAALPIQLASGTNPVTGAAFSERGVEAPGYLRWMQALGVGRYGSEGEYRLPEPLFYALTESVPLLGTFERAASGASALAGALGAESVSEAIATIPSRASAEKSLSNLLNFTGVGAALGGSFSTLTPRALTGELTNRAKKQNAQLSDIAGRLGISVEWLKEQVKSGATSEDIARAISRGEGERTAYEAEKLAKSKEPSARYETLLEALQAGTSETGY